MSPRKRIVSRLPRVLRPLYRLFMNYFGMPIRLVGWNLRRKRCPTCGKRTLSGPLGGKVDMRFIIGVCAKCKSPSEFVNGRWERMRESE
jgi:hypothetical protein